MENETTGQEDTTSVEEDKVVSDILNLLKGSTYRDAKYTLDICINQLQEWCTVQGISGQS